MKDFFKFQINEQAGRLSQIANRGPSTNVVPPEDQIQAAVRGPPHTQYASHFRRQPHLLTFSISKFLLFHFFTSRHFSNYNDSTYRDWKKKPIVCSTKRQLTN